MYDASQLYVDPILGNFSVGYKRMPVDTGPKGKTKKLTAGMGLYGVQHLPDKAPDKTKPWAVVNLDTGDINGRWHPDEESARGQQKALYAQLGKKARKMAEESAEESAEEPWVAKKSDNCPPDRPWGVINQATGKQDSCHPDRASASAQADSLNESISEDEPGKEMSEHVILSELMFAEQQNNLIWIHALPARTWHTEEYGDVPVTTANLQRMVDNFYGKVRGQEIATNYDHGRDTAKGSKASGWIREAEIRDDSLWLGVEPTATALSEIKNGEWKYFSLEWDDWKHPETEKMYQDVIIGGGLTNRPIAKGLVPINFSELDSDGAIEFAADAKKPYGDVTYADPGYQSDKKKRYPLDTETHIRAAWSYINMPKNAAKYTSSQLSSIKSKIRGAMQRIGATIKQMAEDETLTKEAPVTEKELEGPVAESKEMEHSEPGSGGPPTPRTDEDGSDDPAILSGSRRDSPPIVYETEASMELDAKLRDVLGLGKDADIVKAVEDMNTEVKPLREAAKTFSEQKSFAEEYPDQAARLERLEKKDREHEAREFAERFSKLEEGKKGFSTAVLDKLEETHKRFSEKTATTADLSELMELVSSENGIVDFEEHGSSKGREVPENPAKAFSEAVVKIQNDDSLEYSDAVNEAMRRHPDLFQAYRSSVPTREEGY